MDKNAVLKNLLTLILISFTFVTYVSAQEIDSDYKIQGEYSGSLEIGEEEKLKFGLQVIALGDGKFTGVGYHGGLPGDGWNLESPTRIENMALNDGEVTFESDSGKAVVKDGKATLFASDGTELGKIERVVRKSKTLGAKPPEGAVVLFDGTSVDGWELNGKPGKMTDDGLLKQGTATKQKFQSHQLHIEFQMPFMPKARGQARGNSGIYLQGRYEVQMLDSFGMTGQQNECGGIYSIRKPDQNMCFPPLQWQTYDITFHAATFKDGKKLEHATMTVEHNGVVIHEKVKLPKKTTAAPNNEGPEPGFVYLQNHGNEVRYRNIWVKELDGSSDDANESAQTKESLKVNDTEEWTMEYWASLPDGYDEKESWPLMLFLHGAGERGDNLAKVKIHGPPKLVAKGKKFPFIVVSPQCKKGKRWNPKSLSQLLDAVESKYKVDKSKVYVTGLSMGGYGTWALTAHSPERFAAAAPICGGGDPETIPEKIANKVPVWVFHGDADKVVKYSQTENLVKGFKELGVDVKLTAYPGVGHDSWTETYNNPKLYEWLLSHSKK